MRTRTVLLTAAVAAVGLAALGTVVAQQPPPGGYPPPTVPPTGSPGALPPPPVRPYSEWTPNPAPTGYVPKQPLSGVQPAGGYLHLPPGYATQPSPGYPGQPTGGQPFGGKPRLTSPVMAGPDGIRPAGGFDLPPPSMDVPPSRPSPGLLPPPTGGPTPPAGRPYMPPSIQREPVESKFSPTPPAPAFVAPPAPGAGGPTPPPVPSVSLSPVPPPGVLPAATGPMAPPAPGAAGVAPPSGPASPAAPGAPALTPTTPAPATPASAAGMLPARIAPGVVVEAVCPESVVFGQEFQYKLVVRNTSTAAVSQVRVDDELPPGARYVGSDPVGELNGDRLVWLLGALEAGAERHITVRVKPTEEGETRSRATVTFATSVDARTRVTRPRLAVSVAGAEVCRAGEETTFLIKVTNGGSGPATKLVIQARLSDGLSHSQTVGRPGAVIEAGLPSLAPGETQTVPLKVGAAAAGLQWCQIVVAAEGSPDATAKAATNVVEPMLVVKQTGPAKCLVRAEPTYSIEMTNPGTAATDPVLLQSVLPDGFEFLQASDGGSCNGRQVTWRLPSLAAGSNRTVTLKIRAVTASDAQGSLLRTVALAGGSAVTPAAATGAPPARPAGRGLEAKVDTVVVAEGVAAVRFEVVGLENPVAVGKEVTYEVRVMNQGTGPCTNVQLAAALAEGTEYVGATTGPGQAGAAVKPQGQQLFFDPIPSLGVKGETVYRVRVKGNVAGDLRFRVQLSCDQLKTPVAKEESTTFVKE